MRVQPVAHDETVDELSLRGLYVGNHQVLVGRETEVAAMHARDLAQPGALCARRRVGDAPGFDAQGQVPAAVVAFDPAEPVARRLELERPRGFERKTLAPRDLADKPVEAAVVDRVLEARMLAVGAVAEVPLRRDDRFGDDEQLLRPQESHDIGEPRVRRRLAVDVPSPPPTVRLNPASSPCSMIAMKPRSLAKTSTSLTGGTAMAALNLRAGRSDRIRARPPQSKPPSRRRARSRDRRACAATGARRVSSPTRTLPRVARDSTGLRSPGRYGSRRRTRRSCRSAWR